jgi:hypothetical protein
MGQGPFRGVAYDRPGGNKMLAQTESFCLPVVE